MRFIGAGAIAVAAIWTLAQARQAGRRRARRARSPRARSATATGDDRDRDISPAWIIALTLRLPRARRGWLAVDFVAGTPLAAPRRSRWSLIAVPFVLLVGFLIAGDLRLHGRADRRSNSPISGVGILSIVHLRHACWSLVIAADADATRPALVAFALFVTAIVFACATISNDNLQDLKTGQLVGASPWRQQIALIVGVVAGAAGDPAGAQPARARRTASPAPPTSASSRRIRCRRRRRR